MDKIITKNKGVEKPWRGLDWFLRELESKMPDTYKTFCLWEDPQNPGLGSLDQLTEAEGLLLAELTSALGLSSHLVLDEALAGAVDGVNTVYTTAADVIGTNIIVYYNGQRLTKGGVDYTFTPPRTVTFVNPPEVTSPRADYIK